MEPAAGPLTLCTAGHVDHGKTALVTALTGVDTDRLPEEKARGLTIVLGYASLSLPSGRTLSVIDVPGHERFVRTMVAGASGVDMFLLAVAADDGVMPQTVEHVAVLQALGLTRGVLAVTKADRADPVHAIEQARELLPQVVALPCSARTGEGLLALREEIERVAGSLRSRAGEPGPPRLHIDRIFTVRGRGTVVTGTLWSGAVRTGQQLELAPSSIRVRVRGVQVHDRTVQTASAGQRVAVNLTGVHPEQVERGDVLCAPGSERQTTVLDCALRLRERPPGRVQVHHGTRSVAARAIELDDQLWQLRLEQPLLARADDRLVVRRLAPPDTLGGGVVLDADARRHGRRSDVLDRLRALQRGETPSTPAARAPRAQRVPLGAQRTDERDARELAALELRLLQAGPGMLSEAQVGEDARLLSQLCRSGSAVRVSGRLYAHSVVAGEVRARILELLDRDVSVTLAGVRDALGISRKSAQAFLEHLDAMHVTRRLSDDRRIAASQPRVRTDPVRSGPSA